MIFNQLDKKDYHYKCPREGIVTAVADDPD